MPRRALIVVDYGPRTGFGHLRRGAALSSAFAGLGWDTQFGRATEDDTKFPLTGASIDHLNPIDISRLEESRSDFEACIIDSYLIDLALRDLLVPYVSIDDLGNPGSGAAIIVNPAPGATTGMYDEYQVELLLGPRYALVGSDVRSAATAAKAPKFPPERVFVSLGPTAAPNLIDEVITGAKKALPDADFYATGDPPAGIRRVGKQGKATGVAGEIGASDIVICNGGVTALEAAALGRPAIGIEIAKNQKQNLKGLVAAGTLIKSATSGVADALKKATKSEKKFRKMARSGPRVVDGKGADRVATAIDKMFGRGS